MARTGGALLSGRRRSTTSARKDQVAQRTIASAPSQKQEPAAVACHEEEHPATTDATFQQDDRPAYPDVLTEPFPGGPEDISILKTFNLHIATRIWEGDDRGELKTVSHGKKLDAFSLELAPDYVREVVIRSGLAPLVNCSYRSMDRALVSAFVERWQMDTNTFHLPCGEMTILLDDVSVLLHLPVQGELFSLSEMPIDRAIPTLVDLLGVTHTEALTETCTTRGSYVRFNWLRDVYDLQRSEGHLEYAARAYLLHLVGCTLFADKSATYTPVMYLELFRDLDSVQRYAWGAAGLAFLYDQLSYASLHHARQLGGYLTLLKAWIFEHFPNLASAHEDESYTECLPRARRWSLQRGTGNVRPIRIALDRLRTEDVCWTPYADVRVQFPLLDVSFYSGHIRCGHIIQAHLPERVLRQLGHVQSIPRPPTEVMGMKLTSDEVDRKFRLHSFHVLDEVARGPRVTYPGQCIDGYMTWFRKISHPYILPSSIKLSKTAMPETVEPEIVENTRVRRRSLEAETPEVSIMRRMNDMLKDMIDRNLVEPTSEAGNIIRRMYTMSGGSHSYKRNKTVESSNTRESQC